MQSKKEQYSWRSIQKTKRYTDYVLRYPNRDDDERFCPGTAVHASGTYQSLLSPFVPASANCGHDRKNTTVENIQTPGENSEQIVHATKRSSLQKSDDFTIDRPRSNCLFCSVEAVARCCRPIGSLANSSRAPACTFEVVDSLLSSTPTSDWNKIYSCSGLVKLKCKKTSLLVSREIIPSSSIDVSIRDTPDSSDPEPIAGDRRGVPGSSDPVSTAARVAKEWSPSLVARRSLSFQVQTRQGCVGAPRIRHTPAEERIWNGAGANVLFIHLGCHLNTVEAELSLPGLLLLEHQQTTHLP